MYGRGLLTGMKVTIKNFFKPNITEEYPEQRPNISPRWRGGFRLVKEDCISCGLCANACPNSCITVESQRNEETKKKVLTGYKLDLPYCLMCGLCVEACPTNCLKFTHDFELSNYLKEPLYLDLHSNPNLDAPISTYANEPKPEKGKEE